MENDFVHSLGLLGLAVKLKRISDAMVHSGRQMYRELGEDIEPNWYLVFLLLKEHEALSVTEIAEHLRFSHPSVISLVAKMNTNGYLKKEADKADARKHLLRLTDKARKKLPVFEAIWTAGTEGVREMFDDPDGFWEALHRLEIQYNNKE